MTHETEPTTIDLAETMAETLLAIMATLPPEEKKPKGGRPPGGVRAAARIYSETYLPLTETAAWRAMQIAGLPDVVKVAAKEARIANNQSLLLELARMKKGIDEQLAAVEQMRVRPEPRAPIPAYLVEERYAFLSGARPDYLGMSFDYWENEATIEHKWMVGLG